LINLARNIGGSTGIAISTTMVARRQQFHQQRLIENLTPLNGAYQSTLESARQMFMSKGADAMHATAQAQQMIYNMVQRQATLLSFLENFRLLAFTFLAVIPLMLLMKRIKPKKTEIVVE
jgi:DHA2 family multidrug resistance protein